MPHYLRQNILNDVVFLGNSKIPLSFDCAKLLIIWQTCHLPPIFLTKIIQYLEFSYKLNKKVPTDYS